MRYNANQLSMLPESEFMEYYKRYVTFYRGLSDEQKQAEMQYASIVKNEYTVRKQRAQQSTPLNFEVPETPSYPIPSPPPQPRKPKKNSGCLKISLIALGVILITGIIGIIFGEDEPNSPLSGNDFAESNSTATSSSSISSSGDIDWVSFEQKSWVDFKAVYSTHKKMLEIVESLSNGEISAVEAYSQIETRKDWFDQKFREIDYYENNIQEDYLNIIAAMAIYDSDAAESILNYLDSQKTSDLAKAQEALNNVSAEVMLFSAQRVVILQNTGLNEEDASNQVIQEMSELD